MTIVKVMPCCCRAEKGKGLEKVNKEGEEVMKGRTLLKWKAEDEVEVKKGRRRMQEQEAHPENILTASPLTSQHRSVLRVMSTWYLHKIYFLKATWHEMTKDVKLVVFY